MPEKIIKNIIVKGHVKDIYSFWKDFENFPHFMRNIKSVRKTGEATSHWVMQAAFGRRLEWDSQITDVQENKRIAWKSIAGDLQTSGQVTFNELPHEETDITVHMQYAAPAGTLGLAVAKVDNPEKRLDEDLRQFKKYAEESLHLNAG